MAGFIVRSEDTPPTPIAPTSLFGNPATFTAAANTQASDYDKIMEEYANLARSPLIGSPGQISVGQLAAPHPVTAPNVAPQTAPYQQSGDVTSSLAGLSDLATTGGYTPQGIADIRARGISPIRSIYANAQQNAERQRALSGGYSPNFNAVQAQMARDESSQIGDITTNVNAGIAQNVASNRIAAAPAYASASATANAAQQEADARNAAIVNQINEANANRATQVGEFNTGMATDVGKFNAGMGLSGSEFNVNNALQIALANRQGQLGAIQGQANLYGTTPALVNTFGNQVIQAGQLSQGQQQLNQNQQRMLFG